MPEMTDEIPEHVVSLFELLGAAMGKRGLVSLGKFRPRGTEMDFYAISLRIGAEHLPIAVLPGDGRNITAMLWEYATLLQRYGAPEDNDPKKMN